MITIIQYAFWFTFLYTKEVWSLNYACHLTDRDRNLLTSIFCQHMSSTLRTTPKLLVSFLETQKLLIRWTMRAKGAFNMKQKTFSISFKDLPLKHVKPTFLEGESPTLTGCVNNNQKQPRFCFYEFLYLIVFMAFPISIVKHTKN